MFSVKEIETNDFLAFYVTVIICLDGFLDYTCEIFEGDIDEIK